MSVHPSMWQPSLKPPY